MTGRTVGFGLLLPIASRQAADAATLIRELTEEVQLAESVGFSLCLVPEHHGGPSGSLTDPLPTIAWLLAHTQVMRVGSGVLLLPLHSPPRLAEQVNTLHQASGGRVVVGVGAGYQPSDFATFGVSMRTRGRDTEAGLRALRDAWSKGTVNGHSIRPSLTGLPAPPLWVGSWSPPGIRRAAILADGWIADPIRTIDETAADSLAYRQHLQAIGRNGRIVVIREAWVDESDEAAQATFRTVIEPIFRYYARHGAFAIPPGSSADDSAAWIDGRIVCGSVDSAVEQLTMLIDRTAADEVVLGMRHPSGPSHSAVMEAIERVGLRVLPEVQRQISARKAHDNTTPPRPSTARA